MDRVTLTAHAKLNLRLLVGPVRPDGYHPIRSLMVTLAGLDDTVSVTRAATRAVVCAGVAERENLAWKALDVLEARVGRTLPCRVEIDKRIPSKAGLGGGSSDAAAVLVAADALFLLGLERNELEGLAAAVGSDVPFFIRGGAQWAAGRGERLGVAEMPQFAAVIVPNAGGLATRDVYAAFDALPPPPAPDDEPCPAGMPRLAGWVRNDLWPAAHALLPELEAVATALAEAGAETTLLCGSGSAMAGLFASAEAAAAACDHLPGAVRVEPAPPRTAVA